MKRCHPHQAGSLTPAQAALKSLPDAVQQAVRSVARIVLPSDRHDLISIAWLVSQTCDSAERLHQVLCSEARRMRTRCIGTGQHPGECADVSSICGSSNERSALRPHESAEMVELRDPEWHTLASEANGSWGNGVNDLAPIASHEFSEAILDASTLARRMRISERHARRYIARWRQQDALAGDG